MDARRERSDFWDQIGWPAALWICLLVAFSPVLLDLSTHLVENPWARSSLVFPFLAWFATRRNNDSKTPDHSINSSRMMWFWLLVGLAIELFAIAGGAIRFGRIGILVAIVGLCHSLGWMRIGVSMLLIWALPLPKNSIELFSPFMQTFMGQVGATIVPGLSLETQSPLPLLRSAHAQLPLVATDNGVALIHGLAGLGWYKALSKGFGMRESAMRASRWALAGVPIQITLLGCAGIILVWTGEADWSRIVLTHSHWVIIVGLGFALILQSMISAHGEDTGEAAR